MTQDEIIRMAREAAKQIETEWEMGGLSDGFYMDWAEKVTLRVCALVAEATKEKAAKVCDDIERKKWGVLTKGGTLYGIAPKDCAAAIRSMK